MFWAKDLGPVPSVWSVHGAASEDPRTRGDAARGEREGRGARYLLIQLIIATEELHQDLLCQRGKDLVIWPSPDGLDQTSLVPVAVRSEAPREERGGRARTKSLPNRRSSAW